MSGAPLLRLGSSILIIFVISILILSVECSTSDPDPVIGIDLGTSYTSAAYYDLQKQNVEMIPIVGHDRHLLPSMVTILESGILVGYEARNQRLLKPDRTLWDAKRMIGRSFNHPIVQKLAPNWPFKITSVDGKAAFEVDGKGTFLPEQVSAFILSDIRKIASRHLRADVRKAVIGVPLAFEEAQRRATVSAAKIAGFDEIRLVNESLAAVVAYSQDNLMEATMAGQHVLVCDFGGGTFDLTLAKIKDSGSFEVLSSKGEILMGGQDLNNAILNYWIHKFQRNHKKNIREYPTHLIELLDTIEKVKKQLSYNMTITVVIDQHLDGVKFNETLSRLQFELLIRDVINKVQPTIEEVLKAANLKKRDIEHVILVGGSSRVPKYRATISKYFERQVKIDAHPDEEIALGAATIAGIYHTFDFLQDLEPSMSPEEIFRLREIQDKLLAEEVRLHRLEDHHPMATPGHHDEL